jgi:O-antigen biosynthesis alpha-1,2-rhamnosyltransferase
MTGATFLPSPHYAPESATHAPGSKTVRPRRILIDCTHTYRHDCGTGVQRVVRNLVNWSASAGRAMQIECQGVAYNAGHGFQAVGTLPGASHATRLTVSAPNAGPAHSISALPRPIPVLKGAVKRTLSATGLLDPARRINRSMRPMLRSMQHAAARRWHSLSSVHPGAGDVLLLTDTIWNTPEVWDGIRLAVSRGATLGAIVYDLIPLHYADLYPSFAKIFEQWFENVTSLADFVVCISQSVWEDAQSYLATHDALARRRTPLRGGWFRLGEGLDTRAAEGAIRPQLAQLFGNKPLDNPYLVVGSFDPRKNQATVIEAFERLWARGAPARLVIVGRGSSEQPTPLEQFVMRHAEHGRRLYCFHDVEDAELDFCYRNSAALITASYAEGFNLPIVESLSRGRPVLASDIPVHREVAGAHAAYFRPRAAYALADLVWRYERGELRESFNRLDGFRWPDWRQSSRELLDRIVEFYTETTRVTSS